MSAGEICDGHFAAEEGQEEMDKEKMWICRAIKCQKWIKKNATKNFLIYLL